MTSCNLPYFKKEHEQMRAKVRELARGSVAPVARKHDADATFPWATVKQMADLGLLGIPWPRELGGAGHDLMSFIIAIHEMAKVDASHSITISAHTTLGTSPIMNFGTDAQRERFVPALASGRVLGGFGLTEESAGSDAGGTRTTAVRKGDVYVLNGSKRFITHAGIGEVFVVTAVTDPQAGSKGISSFILTKENSDRAAAAAFGLGHDDSFTPMPGFRAGKKEDKLGWRASDTRELLFQDVEVPAENLLGGEGLGFTNFMRTLDSGRIGIAALSLGIAEGAFEQARAFASARRQFGQPISELPGGAVPALRHGHRDRGGCAPRLSRGVAVAARAAVRQGGRDGEALLLGAGHASDDGGGADPRRARLHHGLSGRADDARRQDLRDRRGDLRDPADRHRAASRWRASRAEASRAATGGLAGRRLTFAHNYSSAPVAAVRLAVPPVPAVLAGGAVVLAESRSPKHDANVRSPALPIASQRYLDGARPGGAPRSGGDARGGSSVDDRAGHGSLPGRSPIAGRHGVTASGAVFPHFSKRQRNRSGVAARLA